MKIRRIIAIAVFIAIIVIKLVVDINLYHAGKPNNHSFGPAIVLVCLAGCTFLAKWQSAFMWLFCFWAIFDLVYALGIGQDVFYIGTTAQLDILQRKYPILQILKYVFAVGSIVFYLLTLKKQKNV